MCEVLTLITKSHKTEMFRAQWRGDKDFHSYLHKKVNTLASEMREINRTIKLCRERAILWLNNRQEIRSEIDAIKKEMNEQSY
ncbi:MAG: hypothetical protein ACRCTW_11210 [Lactococcus garvieae]